MAIKCQIHYSKRRRGKHTKYRGLFLKFNKNNTQNFINTFTMKSNSYSVLRPVSQISVIYSESRSVVLALSSNTCIKIRGTSPQGHLQIIYPFFHTPHPSMSMHILFMPFQYPKLKIRLIIEISRSFPLVKCWRQFQTPTKIKITSKNQSRR